MSAVEAKLPELFAAARDAAARAYCPYSRFPVGAAVLGASGRIFSGCNVENSAFGLTICAERNAVFAAVAAGERQIEAVVLFTPTASPVTPCGACRQVLFEFGPSMEVYAFSNSEDEIFQSTLDALFPAAFSLG